MTPVRILLLVVHISAVALLLGGGLGLRKSIENVLEVGGNHTGKQQQDKSGYAKHLLCAPGGRCPRFKNYWVADEFRKD